jgi:hypothetical protein
MTKYLHDFPKHDALWSHEEVLDNELEKLEHDKNFEEDGQVYNSILDEEPAYHSLMNFPEDEEDALYAADAYENPDDDIFEDRESYKNADQDDIYYFI